MPPSRKQDVLIHSDDAGATESVTCNILSAWTSGVLDGFSILANGQANDMLAAALASNADRPARLSLHLNLSEGGSTLPPSELPLLTDDEGYLKHAFFSLLISLLFSTASRRKSILHQIEIEWRAQLQSVLRICGDRKISSIDGHIHVHMLPWTFAIACRLATEFGIEEIRISREPFFINSLRDLFSPYYLVNIIKHIVLNTCSFFAVNIARSSGMRYPPWIVGVLYSGRMTSERALCGMNKIRDNGRIEVLFHVGRALAGERGRWVNRESIAEFYLSDLRSVELIEAARLRNVLSPKNPEKQMRKEEIEE